MTAGFTKLYIEDLGECVGAGLDGECTSGRLLLHDTDHCGGGDYSDQRYGFCQRHATAHAKGQHEKAQMRVGFRFSWLDYAKQIVRIDCERCGMSGRNIVEGSCRTKADWHAADGDLLRHNQYHHAA